MKADLTKEHHWLQKLVGEWEYAMEEPGKDGEAPKTFRGTEVIRSIQGTWIVGEGRGEMGCEGEAISLITLGYDARQNCFVGTWVGSMMSHLWVYSGELDPEERILTLNSVGPGMKDPDVLMRYRDIVELVDEDNRLLRSQVQQDDGTWTEFMCIPYRRKS